MGARRVKVRCDLCKCELGEGRCSACAAEASDRYENIGTRKELEKQIYERDPLTGEHYK